MKERTSKVASRGGKPEVNGMRSELEKLVEDYATLRSAIEDAWEAILRRTREMESIERRLSKLSGQLKLDMEG